jgi:hypothetical protein
VGLGDEDVLQPVAENVGDAIAIAVTGRNVHVAWTKMSDAGGLHLIGSRHHHHPEFEDREKCASLRRA